jgi:hypothetical protein
MHVNRGGMCLHPNSVMWAQEKNRVDVYFNSAKWSRQAEFKSKGNLFHCLHVGSKAGSGH